jgi:methyltransferase
MFFLIVLLWLIAQRLLELRAANRNTARLLLQGGVEFGRKHYPAIVLLHSGFFASLIAEYLIRRPALPEYSWIAFALFVCAQFLRYWVRRTMGRRWTTRVIVVPGERLVRSGLYKFLPHPNYLAVALELFSVPLIFGLSWTALIFTLANGALLLFVRIPCEMNALSWSQHSDTTLQTET